MRIRGAGLGERAGGPATVVPLIRAVVLRSSYEGLRPSGGPRASARRRWRPEGAALQSRVVSATARSPGMNIGNCYNRPTPGSRKGVNDMLRGLAGASIWSEDLNNLLPFYRDMLGLN